jgi:hypothetical protein
LLFHLFCPTKEIVLSNGLSKYFQLHRLSCFSTQRYKKLIC